MRPVTLLVIVAAAYSQCAAAAAHAYVRPGHPQCLPITYYPGTDHARTVIRCIRQM